MTGRPNFAWWFVSLAAAGSALAAPPTQPDTFTVLENDHVRLVFEGRHAGLASMMDLGTGVEHIRNVPGPHALWEVRFANKAGGVTFDSTGFPYASALVNREPGGLQRATFRWTHLPLGQPDGGGSVEVVVELPPDSGIASWTIRVANNTHAWGVSRVDFPKVSGFLEPGAYDLAGAFGPWSTWGSLYRRFAGRLHLDYPDGWGGLATQFLCATRGISSVYMATHDRRAWYKEFVVHPGLEFFIRNCAENMGVGGADYQAPYPAMLGVYRGNWFTGCKIYRRFALTAPWTANGKVADGKASLPAVRNLGLWMREWGWTKDAPPDYDKLLPLVRQAKDYFGVPMGFHWYNWETAAFDTKYPHFFPAKPGVDKLARGMVDLDLKVMPYINGRIVDKANADFPSMVPYAAQKQEGGVYTEHYGNKVQQSPMCPYTAFWQDTIAGAVKQAVTELGVNAVYIDQIAAAGPEFCFNPSHGHPLGGGSWWVAGYRQMLRKVRAFARGEGRSVLITTECAAEPFMDGVDAFLVVTGRGSSSIPVLPAVYSGYAIYFGSDESAITELSDEHWVMEMGRDFLWGDQNGWFGFALFKPENERKRAYLRTLAHARVAGLKYLADGELVGLFDDGSVSKFKNTPFVQGSIWKAPDGSLGLVIANYRSHRSGLAITVDPRDYGLPADGVYRLRQFHPVAGPATDRPAGAVSFYETLEPLEVRLFSITPAK
ncbi:MAG: DUF6259 domain-containing protein [Planctomycetota bacterium]|nr:DUF6259 domain-containing protein [Planctomycetota bacterium]